MTWVWRAGRLISLFLRRHIEELTLSHNHIERIDGLQHMQRLRALRLDCNRLEAVASRLPLPRLETLLVQRNQLACLDCAWLPALRVLNTDENEQLYEYAAADALVRLEEFSLRKKNFSRVVGRRQRSMSATQTPDERYHETL